MLTSAGIRERVLVEVEQLRSSIRAALAPGGSNRFEWLGARLWVDRARLLAIDLEYVRDHYHCETADRVPDEHEDDLDFWSPQGTSYDSWALVELLRSIAVGDSETNQGGMSANFVTLAVLQPLANPAFESLFWLAVSEDLDNRHAAAPDLGEAVGAMAYDMVHFPDSKRDAAGVRAAQVEFVKRHVEPALQAGSWRHAQEPAWVAHCADLWAANRGVNLFVQVEDAVHRSRQGA